MTTGFGIDPIKNTDGVITSSTTSEDIRRIYGSLYTAGLISGGIVTRSASAHTYSVSNGVAAFPIVVDTSTPPKPENRQTVLAPIPQTNLTTTVPATGTRIDIIYAEQLTPATDGSNNVVVRVGTVLPPRAVMLDSYIVSASNLTSSAYVRTGNITYSMPYGSTGTLFYYSKVAAGGSLTTRRTLFNGTFYLPTDRMVHFWLNAGLSSSGAYRFDDSKYCEAGFEVFVDGVKIWTWTSVGLHQAWAEHHWGDIDGMSAGQHTIRVEGARFQLPGTPMIRDRGLLMCVQDNGPIA